MQDEATGSYTFIDLFAGIGGLRLALEGSGCHCVYSNEWNRFSRQTYEANFGEVPDDDITQVMSSDVPDHDILAGGVPLPTVLDCGRFQEEQPRQGDRLR